MTMIYHGKFQTESQHISDGSVDLILTDLPYGTINSLGNLEKYIRINNASSWNIPIKPECIFNVANRILRKNGKLILFSQEPYTSELIMSVPSSISFSQRAIWLKDKFANCLIARKTLVSFYEDILVFYKKYDTTLVHPLRQYFKDVLLFIDAPKSDIVKRVGQKSDHVFRVDTNQFSLCTKNTYDMLTNVYKLRRMDGYNTYQELLYIDNQYKQMYPNTFNLYGKNYKSNIFEYKKDYTGYHPTQKPVALLVDLIETFSNSGDLVVDLTAGSGSTGVACKRTNRDCILIESDKQYINIIKKRLRW
jgi:site-specific DNA-methyltransferase (adenine-specific)